MKAYGKPVLTHRSKVWLASLIFCLAVQDAKAYEVGVDKTFNPLLIMKIWQTPPGSADFLATGPATPLSASD